MMDPVSQTPEELDLPLSERPPTRRGAFIAASSVATSLLLTALTVLPSPYAISQPGPTFDTLASDEEGALVSISGAPTYDTTGELRLTTVSFANASESWFTAGQVIEAYFSPLRSVEPAENIFGTRSPSSDEESAAQWITSQEAAAVSALTAQGVTVPATMTVVEVMPESDAVGKLEVGDILRGIDGEELVSYQDLTDALASRSAGDEVVFTVERDGEDTDVTFDLIALEGSESPRIGIYVDPEFDLPIDVQVAIDSVGGPSAGLMFALAIVDKLTEEDELNGAKVAGTGEIDADGAVYPIGGIAFKLAGARSAGAEYFLAPADNCDEVVGHIPQGLTVVSVTSLDDAYAAIVAIGQGDVSQLPSCES